MGSATFQAFPDSASAGTGGIRPPYRFIEEFRVLTDGAAEARPRLPEPWPIWASAFPRTAPADRMGGAVVRRPGPGRRAAGEPARLPREREGVPLGGKARADRTGEGGAGGPARRIHEFTAGFFSGSGTGCAWMAGTVYFPGRTALAPAPASPSDAGAGARGGNDAGEVPFRTLSVHTGEGGHERRPRAEPGLSGLRRPLSRSTDRPGRPAARSHD